MSQADLGTLDPTLTSGSNLASLLAAWRTAIHSQHSGSGRPTYAVADMVWVKTVSATEHDVYYYDGANDVLLYTVNPTTHAVTFAVQPASETVAGIAAIATAAIAADNTNDATFITPMKLMTVARQYSKAQSAVEATLTDGVTIAWAVSIAQVAKVTLGGSRTVAAATQQAAGAFYALAVIQDATGGRMLTWDATFKFPSGVAPTLSASANARDEFVFRSDGTNMHCVGYQLDV